MKTFDGIKLTARRELVERTRRDRSFLISTLVTLAILVAIIFVPKLLGSDDPTEFDVGLVGPASQPLGQALTAQGEAIDVRINLRQPATAAEAEAAVCDGTLDLAGVVDGRELVAEAEVDEQLNLLVQAASRSVRAQQTLQGAGVAPSEIQAALAPPPLPVRSLEPVDEDARSRRTIATVAVFLLYGQLIGYCFAVAMGVVEEKSTRVVEVLLAAVRPVQLLAGKIIGVGLVGLIQLAIIGAIGLAVAVAAGTITLPPDAAGTIGSVLSLVPARLRLLLEHVRGGRGDRVPPGGAPEHRHPAEPAHDRVVLRGLHELGGGRGHDPGQGVVLPASGSPRWSCRCGSPAGTPPCGRSPSPSGSCWSRSWPWCSWPPACTRAPSCAPGPGSSSATPGAARRQPAAGRADARPAGGSAGPGTGAPLTVELGTCTSWRVPGRATTAAGRHPSLLLAGCAAGATRRAGGRAHPAPLPGDRMVLQHKDRGLELCLGVIATSYPPQCEGLAILNWRWDQVEGEAGRRRHLGLVSGGGHLRRHSFTVTRGGPGPAGGPAEPFRSSSRTSPSRGARSRRAAGRCPTRPPLGTVPGGGQPARQGTARLRRHVAVLPGADGQQRGRGPGEFVGPQRGLHRRPRPPPGRAVAALGRAAVCHPPAAALPAVAGDQGELEVRSAATSACGC